MTTKQQRRRFPRYHFGLAALGQIGWPNTKDKQQVWLWDLSRIGISFKSGVPIEVGTVITVHLKGRGRFQVHCLPVQTIHSTKEPDGSWLVGCKFNSEVSVEIMEDVL